MVEGGGSAKHLQIVDTGARGREQRQRFGLGLERVEWLSAAGSPVARHAIAGEQQPDRRSLTFAQVARPSSNRRMLSAPRARFRLAAASRPGSSDGRIASAPR
jgi:hypothetical protein